MARNDRTIVLRRIMTPPDEVRAKKEFDSLLEKVKAAPWTKSWGVSKSQPTTNDEGFEFVLKFKKNKGQDRAEARQFELLLERFIKASQLQKYQKNGRWIISHGGVNLTVEEGGGIVQDFTPEPSIIVRSEDAPVFEASDDIDYLPLPERIEKGDHYNHIYDREPHINRLLKTINLSVETAFNERTHPLLWGPPACGKTEILLATRQVVRPENVLVLDATQTSAAGAIQKLLKERKLPRFCIVEEIEKREEKELKWLLSPLDVRGEVRKLNFRTDDARQIRMLFMATVNDMSLFEKVCAGALQSRFSGCKIFCQRPSRATLARILERDLRKIPSFHETWLDWIEPTLSFAYDKLGITDPREIKPICLIGRDGLLDKSAQREILATMSQEQIRNAVKRRDELYQESQEQLATIDL